jgi:hypothetical protein
MENRRPSAAILCNLLGQRKQEPQDRVDLRGSSFVVPRSFLNCVHANRVLQNSVALFSSQISHAGKDLQTPGADFVLREVALAWCGDAELLALLSVQLADVDGCRLRGYSVFGFG